MAKTRQASGRHQAHKGGRDGALEQALQAAAPLIIQPGSKAGLAIAQGLGQLVLDLLHRF